MHQFELQNKDDKLLETKYNFLNVLVVKIIYMYITLRRFSGYDDIEETFMYRPKYY